MIFGIHTLNKINVIVFFSTLVLDSRSFNQLVLDSRNYSFLIKARSTVITYNMLPQPTLQKEKSPTDVGVIHKWTARALLKAVKIAFNTILQRQHEWQHGEQSYLVISKERNIKDDGLCQEYK